MNFRIRQFFGVLADTFWLVPAMLVIIGIALALGLVALNRGGLVPQALINSPWLYNGGGARSYDGLVDAMFHMIRQNAAGSPAVLIRLVEVLAAVAGCEHEPGRIATLKRHATLIVADARRTIGAPADLADLLARQARSGLF